MIRYVLAAVALAAAGGQTPARAEFISTLPFWNGATGLIPFGEGVGNGFESIATFGQTITVGSDNVLDGYSFRLRYFAPVSTGPDSVDFATYVMEWDGSKATGPVLFASGPLNLPTTASAYQTFTFDTGDLALTTGKQYVLFLSTSNFFDGEAGSGVVGYTLNGNGYAGGSFVFAENLDNFGNLTTNAWVTGDPGDLAFTASLHAVPAPAGAVLFGVGLASLGGAGLVRRRKVAA